MKTSGYDTHRSTKTPKYQSLNQDHRCQYETKNISNGYDFQQKLEKITPLTQKIGYNKYSKMDYLSPNRLYESKYEKSNKYGNGQIRIVNKNLVNSEKRLPKNYGIHSMHQIETDRKTKAKQQSQTNLQRSRFTDLYSSNIQQQKQNEKNRQSHNSKYNSYADRMSIPSTKSINGSETFDKDLGFEDDSYSGFINDHLTKSSHIESFKHKNFSEKQQSYNYQLSKAKQKKIMDDYFNKIASQLEQQKRLQKSKADNIQTDRVNYETGFLKKNQATRSRKQTKNFYDSQINKIENNSLKAIPKFQKIDNLKYDISVLSTRHTSIYTPVQKKFSIKDFKLGKCIGHGRFGKVYQAVDKKTGFLVALKKISKQMIKSNKLLDQMTLQIKIQMYLSHSNVVKLYGIINQTHEIYLILEHLEQGSLYQSLKNRGKLLSEIQVSSIIRQTVSAIKYLHDLNVVHRDIKPQNILISNKVCKLGDFGWATLCNDRRKTNCGTLDYYAPQMLQGQQYDESIDLWCIGVLTFQLLTGKVPFYHASKKQTVKKIIKVQKMDFPSRVSQYARSFTQSLLVKDPQKRLNVNKLLIHPFITKNCEENI